jgi:flagellar biogenesis protein FliO
MSMDGDLMTVLRVLASLVVVVVLAVVAARLARRAGVRGEGLGLRVVDRVGLTRETAVAVVEVAGRGLVVGTSAHGVTVLAELDPAELAAARAQRRPPDAERARRAGRMAFGSARPATGLTGGSAARGGVTVTRVVAPGTAAASASAVTAPGVPGQRGSGSGSGSSLGRGSGSGTPSGSGAVLDPRTWRQTLDALRDLTVRTNGRP